MRTLTSQTTTSTVERQPASQCLHIPACPTADSPDREAARTVASHPEQGWSLLCNGVLLFADIGELLPTGQAVAPVRHLLAVG